MGDFLTNLIRRTTGKADVLRPRPLARFESVTPWATTEPPDDVGADMPPSLEAPASDHRPDRRDARPVEDGRPTPMPPSGPLAPTRPEPPKQVGREDGAVGPAELPRKRQEPSLTASAPRLTPKAPGMGGGPSRTSRPAMTVPSDPQGGRPEMMPVRPVVATPMAPAAKNAPTIMPPVASQPPQPDVPQATTPMASRPSTQPPPTLTPPSDVPLPPLVAPSHRPDNRSNAAPTVNITIGGIEVRAMAPPQKPERARPPRPAVMSLDDYLERRAQESKR